MQIFLLSCTSGIGLMSLLLNLLEPGYLTYWGINNPNPVNPQPSAIQNFNNLDCTPTEQAVLAQYGEDCNGQKQKE